jgi:DNA mismatch repair protein MutS
VKPGPASRSYGVEVGRLAGLPGDVIRAARKELERMEAQMKAVSPQADLFAATSPEVVAQEAHPALDRLRSLNADDLSPKEAHAILDQLIAQASKSP